MEKKVKVGVLGSGYIAQTDYYPAFKRADIAKILEVTAVCDPVPGRAEEHARRYDLGKAYTDFDRMLGEADFDLLIILSPIPCHFEQAKKALEAGKNTYVQKTMTVTSAEATELCRIARSKGVILAAAPIQMVLGPHKQAKELLDTGKFGKICWARGMGGHPGHEKQELLGIDPAWYYKPGGGPMMDVAVYPLTSLTSFLGPVKRVTGLSGVAEPDRYWEGKKLDIQMDDNTYLLLDFGDAVYASVTGNFCTPQFALGPQVELYGTKGIINVGGWTRQGVPIEFYSHEEVFGNTSGWYRPADDISAPPTLGSTAHTVQDVVHIVDCVANGREPAMKCEQAAHVIEIIEKGYESARDGKVKELATTF